MDYSVVIPVYNEEENVEILHGEVTRAMRRLGGSYEVIYVDDGSTDGTRARLRAMALGDPHVVVIRFRTNFGQSAAMSAGFTRARGGVIISMDGDLQNDPADIPRLVEKLREGHDVVSGWRKERKDRVLLRKIPSKIANRLICHVTGVRLHDTGCSLKVYRREILRTISLYGELHRFIPALARMQGAEIEELAVNHRARIHGRSKYSLTRTFKVLMDISTLNLFLKYLDRPQLYFGAAGLLFALTGSLMCAWLAFERLAFSGDPAEENVILTLTFLLTVTGIQFILYGLLSKLIVHTGGRTPIRAARRRPGGELETGSR